MQKLNKILRPEILKRIRETFLADIEAIPEVVRLRSLISDIDRTLTPTAKEPVTKAMTAKKKTKKRHVSEWGKRKIALTTARRWAKGKDKAELTEQIKEHDLAKPTPRKKK